MSQTQLDLSTLPSRVERFIRRNAPARPGEKWLVGVSGGADSVCLLHLLCQIHEGLGISLHAVHLDHGLRGAEAESDAAYVAGLAHRLKVPLVSAKQDVPAFQKEHHLSPEEAAREVRYLFFHQQALSLGAARVALAHTLDDQAETVLLHLVRGAGGRGLRGMAARQEWHSPLTGAQLSVVRPLLEVSRAETEACCRAHDLNPREDSSNRSPRFLRNRVRSGLLPLLKQINPRTPEVLARAARLLSEEQDAFASLSSPLMARLVQTENGRVAIDIPGLLAQPVGIQRYLLRAAYALLSGHLRDLEAQHIERMRLLLTGAAGRLVNLPGGIIFLKDYRKALLSAGGQVTAPGPPPPAPSALAVPGLTTAIGYRWRARLVSPLEVNLHQVDPYRACLDAAAAGRDILVRFRQPGDRFQPLGMTGEKKLQDFMVDARIPRRLRPRVPIVCSPAGILWVTGYRIDHRARVTDATREVLLLEAEEVGRLEGS
ncbi:MAG: tRNA lysidine(34) synthetase TilS [Chloroflexi bacterium]|nr:tRNA lysidine(34) synthetase TilS [Chloroflexota bacterium]